MSIVEDRQYVKSHEWIQQTEPGIYRVGISDHAQSELGDIVFVNLPAIGDVVTAGSSFADIESVKAVADIYSPLSGTVVAINIAVQDYPAFINTACYDAWLIEVESTGEFADLLDAAEYKAIIEAES